MLPSKVCNWWLCIVGFCFSFLFVCVCTMSLLRMLFECFKNSIMGSQHDEIYIIGNLGWVFFIIFRSVIMVYIWINLSRLLNMNLIRKGKNIRQFILLYVKVEKVPYHHGFYCLHFITFSWTYLGILLTSGHPFDLVTDFILVIITVKYHVMTHLPTPFAK